MSNRWPAVWEYTGSHLEAQKALVQTAHRSRIMAGCVGLFRRGIVQRPAFRRSSSFASARTQVSNAGECRGTVTRRDPSPKAAIFPFEASPAWRQIAVIHGRICGTTGAPEPTPPELRSLAWSVAAVEALSGAKLHYLFLADPSVTIAPRWAARSTGHRSRNARPADPVAWQCYRISAYRSKHSIQ